MASALKPAADLKCCPYCGGPVTIRNWTGPRQGGKRVFLYCAFDEAAWEIEPPLARQKSLSEASASPPPVQETHAPNTRLAVRSGFGGWFV